MKKLFNIDGAVDTVIVATTVEGTKETPSYLVDKRLIDFILDHTLHVSLDEMKAEAKRIIDQAADVEAMSKGIEEFFYIHKVLAMLKPEEEAPKAPVTNEFRKSPVVYAEAHNETVTGEHPDQPY